MANEWKVNPCPLGIGDVWDGTSWWRDTPTGLAKVSTLVQEGVYYSPLDGAKAEV